ncbi:MAG: DUF308 domain-containing protein [Actinomycetota bacterium]
MQSAADERTMAKVFGPWWLFLLTGVAWLFFAFFLLSFDPGTVAVISLFAGIAFIAVGLLEFLVASAVDSWKWAHVVLGVLCIIAGVIAFWEPVQTFVNLAILIGWFILIRGTFDVVLSLMARKVVELWWLRLIIGIVQILIAFWAIGYPGRSIVLLVVWVAAWALSRGVVDIALAFHLKEAQE